MNNLIGFNYNLAKLTLIQCNLALNEANIEILLKSLPPRFKTKQVLAQDYTQRL